MTDDERIREIVQKNNFNCLITSKNAKTGTDRIAEVINDLNYDYFINVQGDEPLVNPSDIRVPVIVAPVFDVINFSLPSK